MKSLFTLTSVAALAVSALAENFEILAKSKTGSDEQPLNAYHGTFARFRNQPSYCPETVPGCVVSNKTYFGHANDGRLYLSVVVPGGQEVYADPNHVISYTNPHTSYKPPGSTLFNVRNVDGRIEADDDFKLCPHQDSTGTFDVLTLGAPSPDQDQNCESVVLKMRPAGGAQMPWSW